MSKKQKKKNKFRHLRWEDRVKLEGLLAAKIPKKQIAEILGFSQATIYLEIQRGAYKKRDSATWKDIDAYSPNLAQSKYDAYLKEKGADLKIGSDLRLVQYIEKKILEEKKSPAAILADIEREGLQFNTEICLSTIYNYIRKGVFLNVELSDCPQPQKKKKKRKVQSKIQKKIIKGESIDKRPPEILERKEFGHWEMDTVVGAQGKSKKSLLVLTERKSRTEIIEPLKEHTVEQVAKALDRIERSFGEKEFRKIFKTITVDNGTEFSNYELLEKSRRNKQQRTKVYYCHPYRSIERASNENLNKMIRRFVPKGTNFDHMTRKEIKEVEEWMNHYPRPQFEYFCAWDFFQLELEQVA